MKIAFISCLVFALILFCTDLLIAQHNATLYGSMTDGFYVNYKMQKKETLFAIGRKYGVKYQRIMEFNGMISADTKVNQIIKIPILKENFVNKDVQINDDLLPLVHIVQPKEGLYRIGINHYRTPIQLLMKWNSLENYNLKIKQEIIVGYVKSEDAVISYIGAPDKFDNQRYIPPVRTSFEQTRASKKSSTEKTTQSSNNRSVLSPSLPLSPDKSNTKGGEGHFANDFNEHWSEGTKGQKNATFKSTVFNSNSGWNDGKFYAMSSKVPAQSIIQITNPANGKKIYAKVLGGLPANFKNKGYELILSSAGARQIDLEYSQLASLQCLY